MLSESEIQRRKEFLEGKRPCLKLCYATRKAANKYIAETNLKSTTTQSMKRKLTDAYFCSTCNNYHVTSWVKEKSRDIKKRNHG